MTEWQKKPTMVISHDHSAMHRLLQLHSDKGAENNNILFSPLAAVHNAINRPKMLLIPINTDKATMVMNDSS